MPTNIIYFILFSFSIHQYVCRKYTNYSLYRGIPVNVSQLNFYRGLNDLYDINYWKEPTLLFQAVDFVISPKDEQKFLKDAKKHKLHITKTMNNIQWAFDQQKVRKYISRQMSSMNWETYYRLNDIYNWLADLSRKYRGEVQIQSIGKSYEKRDIMAVRVVLQNSSMRSTVIIEGGIHAREWISTAFVTYLINSIIQANSSKDSTLKYIAQTYEWIFVPVLNPDGYEYSHTKDRLWRKNRHGPGIDLNRNFGISFGTLGVNWNKQSNIFCGPHAFSEKESKAMAALVKAQSKKLEYYISFHSYGQYIVIPYAHSMKHDENYGEVLDLCKLTALKIQEKYGTSYQVGTSYETIGYVASGLSCCWVKKTFSVPYVVVFELRDKGQYGFALPTEQILPTCIETLEGLKTFLSPRIENITDLQRDISGQGNNNLAQILLFFHVLLFIILCIN